jgi:hypothetical protein
MVPNLKQHGPSLSQGIAVQSTVEYQNIAQGSSTKFHSILDHGAPIIIAKSYRDACTNNRYRD